MRLADARGGRDAGRAHGRASCIGYSSVLTSAPSRIREEKSVILTSSSRRWKAVALLAVGVAIGTALVATPALGHVTSWLHLRDAHVKPWADARYANAIKGTDRAKNADKLDGVDSTGYVRGGGTVVSARKSLSFGTGVASFLTLPGLLVIGADCSSGIHTLHLRNVSGASLDVYWWEAGAAPTWSVHANNEEFGFSMDNPGTGVLQLGLSLAFPPIQKIATVTVASRRSATHCFFQAQAVRQG